MRLFKQLSSYHGSRFFVSSPGVSPAFSIDASRVVQAFRRQGLLCGEHDAACQTGEASERTATDAQVARGQRACGPVYGGADGGEQLVARLHDEPADDDMPRIEDVAQRRHP